MPLPWQEGQGPVEIQDVGQRAITVQQLDDLRVLLQRLCATGLLKNTSAFSKKDGSFGSSIPWSDINMYQITAEVITKVIPFVDPEGASRRPGRQWYSWVELVASKPQRPKLMISHSWAGRFKDFMAVVDHLASDKGLSIHTPIWVCTFANNQFGEDFGASLQECPFIRALQLSPLTVLVVDRGASSLTRSWCGLELHYSILHSIELEIYTSLGRVGSDKASSGPLVEAVKRWDIRRTEAAEAAYRRQIMNYVAGADEASGLRVADDGSFLLEAGRPQLADEREDLEYRRRAGGTPEYAHEARLFRQCDERFEDLNMAVRAEVLTRLGRQRKARGCDLGSVEERGVTLGQLRVFAQRVKAECGGWETPMRWEEVTLQDAVTHLVKPATRKRRCSYVELVADGPQVPQYFVSALVRGTLDVTVAGINWFAEAMQISDATVLFVDTLCYNLWTWDEDNAADKLAGSIVENRACRAIRECKGVLQIFTEDAPLNRIWRLVHLEFAQQFGKNVYMAWTHGVLACTRPFPDGARILGHFSKHVAMKLASIRVEDAEGFGDEAQLELIRSFFAHGCSDAEDQQRYFARFNMSLQRMMAGTLLHDAVGSGEEGRVAKICGIPGLCVNDGSLKGHHGDSAVHLAACRGAASGTTLRALLSMQADPNSQDALMERPLHWAALAGEAGVAAELLAARADVLSESVFGETPLQVAEQNPAAFLGVSSAEVVEVLRKAEASRCLDPLLLGLTPRTSVHHTAHVAPARSASQEGDEPGTASGAGMAAVRTLSLRAERSPGTGGDRAGDATPRKVRLDVKDLRCGALEEEQGRRDTGRESCALASASAAGT